MSRQSAKAARRSAKTSGPTAKKSTKPGKKAAKTARRAKQPVRSAVKSARRSPAKAASKASGSVTAKVTKAAKANSTVIKPASKPAPSRTRPSQSKPVQAKPAHAKASVARVETRASAKPVARPVVKAQPSALPPGAADIIRTISPPTQPIIVAPVAVLGHKYQVGESVWFTSPSFGRTSASGNYTIVKQLPSESDDYQYRIKSETEAFERVAKESQLDKL